MGISVSRRYGKAHDRNKAKRQIRAIWHEYSDEMDKGFHVIVRPGEGFRELCFLEKKHLLLELLRRSGVMRYGKNS